MQLINNDNLFEVLKYIPTKKAYDLKQTNRFFNCLFSKRLIQMKCLNIELCETHYDILIINPNNTTFKYTKQWSYLKSSNLKDMKKYLLLNKWNQYCDQKIVGFVFIIVKNLRVLRSGFGLVKLNLTKRISRFEKKE